MLTSKKFVLSISALIALTAFTQADVLIVNDAYSPPAYETISAALDSAAHQDTILGKYGTGEYNEQVVIEPKDTTEYCITLIGEADTTSGNPPYIEHKHTTGASGADHAVVEIINDPTLTDACEDMRITFKGFEAYGDSATAAIVYYNSPVDTSQTYYTGLFIRDNILCSDDNGTAAIQIGRKTPDVRLYYQSVSWGEFTNNIIINNTTGNGDGISSHHFVGNFYNNRITSNSEGIHLGLGLLDERHGNGDPPYDNGHRETDIQHNLLYENPNEGIHFTHGSKGTIYNNIIVGVQPGDGNGNGIFIGNTSQGDTTYCSAFPNECMTSGLAALVDEVNAKVISNTIDRTKYAILLVKDATLVLRNNIITRTEGDESYGFSTVSGDSALALLSGYNLFWGNDDDYNPSSLEASTDVNEDDPGGSHPKYQGWLNTQQTRYSYMLQTDDEEEEVCDHAAGPIKSKAIDAGDPNTSYNDQRPPGLHESRNDIGAYGGPHAIWHPTEADSCLEYTYMPD